MIFTSNKIKSKYNEREQFDFRSVPTDFKSVPESTIMQLRNYCLEMNRNNYKGQLEPSALKNMLQSVSGLFNHAYTQVDGDYTSRRNNLEQAYEDGMADISEQLTILDADVDEHNNVYEEYAEAHERVYGRRPSNGLRISEEKVQRLRDKYAKIESKGKAK